jgi:hypothetical protein
MVDDLFFFDKNEEIAMIERISHPIPSLALFSILNPWNICKRKVPAFRHIWGQKERINGNFFEPMRRRSRSGNGREGRRRRGEEKEGGEEVMEDIERYQL